MNLRWVMSGVLLFGILAHAQIKSGTILVFAKTSSGFVIAADSRVTFDKKPPDDNQCKIAAFKANRVIFAASGGIGYTQGSTSDSVKTWDAYGEAKAAVMEDWSDPVPANAEEAASRLSAVWASKMINRWQETRLMRPDGFKLIVDRMPVINNMGSGLLTNGVFAIEYKGQIAMAFVTIEYVDGEIQAKHTDVDCSDGIKLCASGEIDTFAKYVFPGPFMPGSDQTTRVIKLVDLTISEDNKGTVNGPVDVLEMLNDGTINWKQKKEVCPDSRD